MKVVPNQGGCWLLIQILLALNVGLIMILLPLNYLALLLH